MQLPRLSSLLALELLDTRLPSEVLSGLTALPNLRALQLDGQALPSCLPALTQLKQLVSLQCRAIAGLAAPYLARPLPASTCAIQLACNPSLAVWPACPTACRSCTAPKS